jgi:hypothetical protein
MKTGVDTLKKVGAVPVGVRGDPRRFGFIKIETLTIETRWDKWKLQVFVVARPELCEGGINTGYLDRVPNLALRITSAPHGIDLKRAREIAREAKAEIKARYGDTWDFVLDVCAKRGYLLADDPAPPEITDDEWSLLDTLTFGD